MENKILAIKYKEGIFDVCTYLLSEMKVFLEIENRYYGRVKSYMNNIRDAVKDSEKKTNEEDFDTYGRILYILRPQIYKDFSRLGKKKLSPADRIIVIIHKILSILESIDLQDEIFKYEREARIINKVITKMYDNIRNRGKEDSLYYLTDLIIQSISQERFGKKIYDQLDLISIEFPKPKEKTIDGEETLISTSSIYAKKEISFINDEKRLN